MSEPKISSEQVESVQMATQNLAQSIIECSTAMQRAHEGRPTTFESRVLKARDRAADAVRQLQDVLDRAASPTKEA